MLKGIDPLLSPELLKILCEMGHGEEIVLVDANFTSQTLGQGKPLVRLPGIDLQRASAALLSVFPLDAMVDQPVAFMKVCNTADGYLSAVQRTMLDQIAASGAMRGRRALRLLRTRQGRLRHRADRRNATLRQFPVQKGCDQRSAGSLSNPQETHPRFGRAWQYRRGGAHA